MTEEHYLPAGEFSSWLRHTQSQCAPEKENGTDVPCGACTACCTSSYFIHIRPEETRTLSRIPKALLFPAPGLPKGIVLLGYNEKGLCPLFIEGRCSIYEDRPLTCRTYDCRIFAAAGIYAGNDDKTLINQRIRLWKFSYPAERDRDRHAAIQAAAQFLQTHTDCFPAGAVPGNPTQLALLALKVHEVFLRYIEEKKTNGEEAPDVEIVQAVMEAIGLGTPSPDGV